MVLNSYTGSIVLRYCAMLSGYTVPSSSGEKFRQGDAFSAEFFQGRTDYPFTGMYIPGTEIHTYRMCESRAAVDWYQYGNASYTTVQ